MARHRCRPAGRSRSPGILDLTRAAATTRLLAEPVSSFVGGRPAEVPERYAVADPAALVPAACPVWAVHAEDDEVVPAEQSSAYVAARQGSRRHGRAGAWSPATTSIIDPDAPSFPTIREADHRGLGQVDG